MFELTADESKILKCQNGISSPEHGGRRRSSPYAFTEQGVAMLSSVRSTPTIVYASGRTTQTALPPRD